ncbi:MAG: PGAP1-like protein, partial [Bacteroidota bacterium]
MIAHSQGGLVTRWAVDQTIPNTTSNMPNARQFGGIVTFGSPHLGARISNAVSGLGINFPEMDIFLNGACKKLGGAMLDGFVQNSFGWMADGLGITGIAS